MALERMDWSREFALFLRRLWPHALIAPAMVILFTALHETAHAVAALAMPLAVAIGVCFGWT